MKNMKNVVIGAVAGAAVTFGVVALVGIKLSKDEKKAKAKETATVEEEEVTVGAEA